MTLSEQAKGLIDGAMQNMQIVARALKPPVSDLSQCAKELNRLCDDSYKLAALLDQALKELEASDGAWRDADSAVGHLIADLGEMTWNSKTRPIANKLMLRASAIKVAIESARTRLSPTAKGGV